MLSIAGISGTVILVVGVCLVVFLVAALALNTFHGTMIDAHPHSEDSAPGTDEPSEPSGMGRTPEDPDSPTDIPTHGMR